MRDHGYHGEHRRHARDAHAPADTPAARAHDHPRRAARDALKLRVLLDPEARKAARQDYQRKVEAAEAGYAAKPTGRNQERAPEQLKPREPRPEHAPPETRDRPASKIAAREDRLDSQQEERRRPQRSWMPRADVVKGISDIGVVIASVAVALGDIPSKWDAVAVCAAGAVVSNVAWANRRRKEKHGDRPEG